MRRRIRADRPEWERFYLRTLPPDVAMLDYTGTEPNGYADAAQDTRDMVDGPLDRIWRIAEGLKEKMARLDPRTGLPREDK